jgi:enoyl reductase-like protein
MLTRKHAEEIVALVKRFGGWTLDSEPVINTGNTSSHVPKTDIVSAFGPPGQWNEFCGGVFAPEEVFFATMLSILGYIQENSSKVGVLFCLFFCFFLKLSFRKKWNANLLFMLTGKEMVMQIQ